MGEKYFLTGRVGWQGEEENPETSSKLFSPMVPFQPICCHVSGLLGNTFVNFFSWMNERVMAKTCY